MVSVVAVVRLPCRRRRYLLAEPKTKPFRRIHGWSQSDPLDMVWLPTPISCRRSTDTCRYILTTRLLTTASGSKQVTRSICIFPSTSIYIYLSPAVTFQLCRDKKGMTWDVYRQGIDHWRRVKKLTIPSNPATPPQRRLIGYSGLSNAWINRVNNEREGIVDPAFPYRWGYCLYIADDVGLWVLFPTLWPFSRSHPHLPQRTIFPRLGEAGR